MTFKFVDTDDNKIKTFTKVKKLEVVQDTVWVTHVNEYDSEYTFTCKLTDIISITDDTRF